MVRIAPARMSFIALAWVMAAAVVAQVFLAGLALMHDGAFWSWHVGVGNLIGLLPVVLAVVAFAGRLGNGLGWWSVGLWVLIGMQHAFIGMRPSAVAALHVVNALAIFMVTVWMARSAVPRAAPPGPVAIGPPHDAPAEAVPVRRP